MSGSQSCLDVAAFQSLRSDVLADPVLVSALSLVAAELEINSPQTQARTLQEWQEWLSDQGLEDVDIDAYVDRLKSLGLSDDEMAMVGSHSASTRSLIEGLNSLGSGLLARVLNLLDEAAAQSADVSSVAGGVGSFRGAMYKKQPRSDSALGQVGSHSSNRHQELEKKESADLVHDTAAQENKHEPYQSRQFELRHQAPIDAKNLRAEAGRDVKEETLADHAAKGVSREVHNIDHHPVSFSDHSERERTSPDLAGELRGQGKKEAFKSVNRDVADQADRLEATVSRDESAARAVEHEARNVAEFPKKISKDFEHLDVDQRVQIASKERYKVDRMAEKSAKDAEADVQSKMEHLADHAVAERLDGLSAAGVSEAARMDRGDEQMMGATRDSASQSQPEKRKLFTRIKNAIKNIVDS